MCVHCGHYVHAHTYACVMEISLWKCRKEWKWWRWFELFSTDWGWDIDQRKMISDTKKEPSGMAGGSSREKGGGPGTDEEAWTPTQSRESGSWSWWIQTADNDIMCQVTPKWAAQCSMQVQANITLEFQKEWKHCSALSCVLYGKSRRKTCRPLLPLVNSFSFSH